MTKSNKVNIFFIIIAIIHFILVLQKTPFQSTFAANQILIWFIVKVISLIFITIFWQLIPYTVEQIKNRNILFKEILILSSIYLIINIFVLFLIWPGHTHTEFLHMYQEQKNFGLIFFWHWLSNFEIAIAYNILPSIGGVAIINAILQSFIVGYCVYLIKKNISKNLYLLAYIPFLIPAILIQNHTPIRLIFISWLTVLLFTYLFTHTGEKINNKFVAFLIGTLSSIITSIRTECYPLIFILPIMVFCLKIYEKKIYVTFLITFIITFSAITGIQKINMSETYELHNLCFIYEEIVNNNLQNKNFENDKNILKKVFIELEEKGHDSELNITDKENTKQALYVLTKMLLENSRYFVKRNIDLFSDNDYIITGENMYKPELDQYFSDEDYIEITPINSELRDNVIHKFTYGTDKINLNKIYNPCINLFLIGFLFIYGIIKRTSFYTFFTICWLTIISIILLTMPWENYLYLWGFFLNTWLFFTYTIIEIFQKIFNLIKKK